MGIPALSWQLSLCCRPAVYNSCESNRFWGNMVQISVNCCAGSGTPSVPNLKYIHRCPLLRTLVVVNLCPIHSLSVPCQCSVISVQYMRIYACTYTHVQYVRIYVHLLWMLDQLHWCSARVMVMVYWFELLCWTVSAVLQYVSHYLSMVTLSLCECTLLLLCECTLQCHSDSVTSALAKTVSLCPSSWWSILVSKWCV